MLQKIANSDLSVHCKTAFMSFYTIFYPEDDPRGSKHVALINTKNLVALTVLVCIFVIRKHKGMSALNIIYLLLTESVLVA